VMHFYSGPPMHVPSGVDSVSASGLLFYCRTARRSSALLPRISPSIS
jgi:hypothetical protein